MKAEITISVRLAWWARSLVWIARQLFNVACRLAIFAVDHGTQVDR